MPIVTFTVCKSRGRDAIPKMAARTCLLTGTFRQLLDDKALIAWFGIPKDDIRFFFNGSTIDLDATLHSGGIQEHSAVEIYREHCLLSDG
jgi:hypothetical protein